MSAIEITPIGARGAVPTRSAIMLRGAMRVIGAVLAHPARDGFLRPLRVPKLRNTVKTRRNVRTRRQAM